MTLLECFLKTLHQIKPGSLSHEPDIFDFFKTFHQISFTYFHFYFLPQTCANSCNDITDLHSESVYYRIQKFHEITDKKNKTKKEKHTLII